jgi:hypothetical protein
MSPPTAYRPAHPLAAAKPIRKIFDAWNSSSTGHQRADNNLSGSTSWRESRSQKLALQFSDATGGGGKRVADTVGAGAEDFGKDGRLENGAWTKGASGLREKGQVGVWEALNGGGSQKSKEPQDVQEKREQEGLAEREDQYIDDSVQKQYPQLLRGLTIYVNGSTFPLISDHKLKQLITRHGGHLSIHLGRNTVTHVIIGKPNGIGPTGAGGGLAGSKIQKEITKVRGKGVKFVSTEWLLESIKAGIRLPESRFTTLKLAAKDQKSVYNMFEPKKQEEMKAGTSSGG